MGPVFAGRRSGKTRAKHNSPDALLFDLGGVIVDIDFRRVFDAWSAYSGVPSATLGARFTQDAHYERHERGEISAAEYFESLRSSLGIRLTDEEFERGWNAIFSGEIPGIPQMLHRAKQHFPLYVFSNSNTVHQACWMREYASTLSVFRRVFVSCDLGKRKPEPEAFMAVAREIGVPLPKILFFDDLEANVAAARKLGMQALHVRSAADVGRALEPVLTGGSRC